MEMWYTDCFPTPLKKQAFAWYFNFPVGSIRSWNAFERAFLNKFGEEKTLVTFLRELISIKMEKKEKIKYFNQFFAIILNKFPTDAQPIEALTVNYYTSSLHPCISMFVKRATK